jgi:uncharacterized protein DUF2442
MSTLHNKYDSIESLIYNEGLKIKSVEFNTTNSKMFIYLTNNLSLVVPTRLYKRLNKAPVQQLKNFKLIGSGTGIHWPDLDEDLSLKGFLNEFLRQLVNKKNELVIS